MENNRPKVGMGVYIADGKGNILLLQRSLKHHHQPGVWSAPGGHLEMGESFLECAKREVLEEVGLEVQNIEFLGVVNNIFSPEKHYVNVDVLAKGVSGVVKNMEPEKCEKVEWFDLENLPKPLMLAAENLFKNYPEVKNKLKTSNSLKSLKYKQNA